MIIISTQDFKPITCIELLTPSGTSELQDVIDRKEVLYDFNVIPHLSLKGGIYY
jgi:hypothetical protein